MPACPNIPGCGAFAKIYPLEKGWSSDRKYYIETYDGCKLLVRISEAVDFKAAETQFNRLRQISKSGIPMPLPVDMGLCKNIFQLLTWVDGKDVESALPAMSKEEQYKTGLKAGKLLKKYTAFPRRKT